MKKIKQNLLKFMAMAGFLAIQTQSNAQCLLKVRLDVTPTNCKGDCSGTATIVNLENIPNVSYFWSNGATTQTITGLCEGPISVTVWQGSEACSFDLNSAITIAYEVKVNCTATVPNAPGTITTDVSGGVAPYSYDWFTTPHQYTSSITNLPAGSYFVIVTDANGCSDYTSCDILPAVICNGRSVTMGGWGAPPNGNNPASYLYAKFALAFPSGAQIGCNNKLKVTTPVAVTNFLPCSGTPAVLPSGTLTNPGGSINNTLAGQAMALTLTLGFDTYDPNFNPSNVFLGNQVINGGTFNGMTVSQLLAEANKRLGGCTTTYTISQLNDALNKVNKNYDNGANLGYLKCSVQSKFALENGSDIFSYSVRPNPALSNTTVSIVSSNDDQVSIDVYNIVGKKVSQVYNTPIHAQEEMKFSINTSDLPSGIYIININSSEKVYQQKLIVSK